MERAWAICFGCVEMIHMVVHWLNKVPKGVVHVRHMPSWCPMYGLVYTSLSQVAMDKPKCAFLQAVIRGTDGTEYMMKVTVALFLVAMHANALIDDLSCGPLACLVLDDNATMNLVYEGHDTTDLEELTKEVG